jgi:hypothetical protein
MNASESHIISLLCFRLGGITGLLNQITDHLYDETKARLDEQVQECLSLAERLMTKSTNPPIPWWVGKYDIIMVNGVPEVVAARNPNDAAEKLRTATNSTCPVTSPNEPPYSPAPVTSPTDPTIGVNTKAPGFTEDQLHAMIEAEEERETLEVERAEHAHKHSTSYPRD